MPQKFTNRAKSILQATISSLDTLILIYPPEADSFPIADTGSNPVNTLNKDWFKVALISTSGQYEVMYVRTRELGSPVLSNIIRGQDGTTAMEFLANSFVVLDIVADDWNQAKADIEALRVIEGNEIASASTITIPEIGTYFKVNNAVTINAINASTPGRSVKLNFVNGLTLNHSTALDLGGSNYIAAPGCILEFVNTNGANWRLNDQLRPDLGNGADPVKGLGILPFNATLSYSSPSAGAKLKQHATLQDRGAVGDGVTNDAAAINLLNLSGASLDLLGKNYLYTGTFNPVAKFFNGVISATNRDFNFFTQTGESAARVVQHRSRVKYHTTSSVIAWVPDKLVMAGFRFMGSYKKGEGRLMRSGSSNGQIIVNNTTDLAIETVQAAENWYAIFAVCQNGDDAVKYVNMPFFRAAVVAGSVVNLAACGETDADIVTGKTYTGLSTNELVGAEVLIINENKFFSGRTTTVTANTSGSVTLASVGSIAANDFFLVAPPGWDNYVYLGSWYRDTSEPRNMADTGSVVGSYGVNLIGLASSGALSLSRFSCAGQVSPLATAALYQLTYTLSTASDGNAAHYFYMDGSNHFTNSSYYEKISMTNQTSQTQVMTLPFSSAQEIWINTAGSLQSAIAGRTMRLHGWVEP